ncbi:MAG TPA: hypothetical protein VFF74_04435 [Methylophilaceae bacterium]|nr:hypothetical protein [Methylophilaceae bacterium]
MNKHGGNLDNDIQAGAAACLQALRQMEQIATAVPVNHTMTAEDYYKERALMVATLVQAAKPLSPFMSGFMATLAEYIDASLGCGQPVSETWQPEAIKIQTEVAVSRAKSYATAVG